MEGRQIFECVQWLELERTKTTVGVGKSYQGSKSSPGTTVELCCWRECSGHSILVLVCSNGYIVVRVVPVHGQAQIWQLKWYESREQHILGVTLDPHGEWLCCASLNGDVYLVPVLALIMGCAPTHNFGVFDDITKISAAKKKAPPTCIVWWESMDENHTCITGSQAGEITFFDLMDKQDVITVSLSGCIDTLLLAHHTDSATHLLIGLRGGQWQRMLLEEHYHEAAGTSYTDARASGFEILTDDIVFKSYLTAEGFEIKPCPEFSELTRLSTHDWRDQHFLGTLNLQNHKLQVYSYDFDLSSSPLKTYQLVSGANNTLLTDRLTFVVSHDDSADPCAFTLTVMSNQRALASDLDDQAPHANAIIQQFTIPSQGNLVGFFSTWGDSHGLASGSGDLGAAPTHLGGCVLVTTTAVYQCRQRMSPESIFLEMALSPQNQEKAEEFGISLKLDICGLYKVAAEKKMSERQFAQAMKLFELSRCAVASIIESFARLERVPELVHYLHQATYDDTAHAPQANPKQVQDVLLKCFIHQCLTLHDKTEGIVMKDKFSQFINDKFLYDKSVAMDLLIQSGLKEQLFELAKTHHKLTDVLDLLVQRGALELDMSVQSSLASRQYAETLTQAADGLFLYRLMPSTFVRFLVAKPSIIAHHLPYLRSLLSQLDASTLLRLASLFDPSHTTIRPMLVKAHSHHRHRSNSTGSLFSLASTEAGPITPQEEPGPRLEAYTELFLTVLIILNHRRRQKPAGVGSLFSLSSLRQRTSSSSSTKERDSGPLSDFSEGAQWVRGSTISCGLNHAAMVIEGNLYTWGSTKNGKLGHGDIEEEGKAMPLRVETLNMLGIHVLSVSCGAEHTIAVCQEGIFSWGSSSHGQLGHGDTLKRTRPVQIAALADKDIVSIFCGQYHSLALSDDHRVWSWGWGVHGQLGLRTVDDKLLPTHASLLDEWHVSLIAAGYGHSAVLTTQGKVLTFGNGMYGQLGHGSTEKQSTPRVVEYLAEKTVYLLACGNFHTVAVTTDQIIFCWGKNLHRPRPVAGASIHGLKDYKRSRYGQAANTSAANTLLPQPIPDLELDDTVVQVNCGSFHSVLLTTAGSVYTWGSNVHGQLGHSHTPELPQPKKMAQFDGNKIVATATGDEFSVAVDDRGTPWAWGRSEQGQLGMDPQRRSGGSKQCLVTPSSITALAPPAEGGRRSRESSPEAQELPLLEIDLGWKLPDFATIDSPHAPYGRKALNAALHHLHGFYRSSMMLWACQDWRDWESMAKIYEAEKQWPQALAYSLDALEGGVKEHSIIPLVEGYLEKFVYDVKEYHSPAFVQNGLHLFKNLLSYWEERNLDLVPLETTLLNFLPALAYPLSLIVRSSATVACTVGFSFAFQLQVAKEVMDQVTAGKPMPEELLTSTMAELPETEKPSKFVIETSIGDTRLWSEVLRNLSKDLSKTHAAQITEPTLSNIESYQEKAELQEEANIHQTSDGIVAFSCGHAFSESQFHSRILMEFVERVQDFPIPIPHTLRQLQLHFKQSACYPSACPYCVFQHLRKVQLQECPGVPIRPWNP